MANKDLPSWDSVRPKIQKEFVKAGIERCELELPECRDRMFPTLAHSKKRVDWYTLEDVEAVIFACVRCHQMIEHLGKKKIFTMEEIVERVRARRIRPVASIFQSKEICEFHLQNPVYCQQCGGHEHLCPDMPKNKEVTA